MAIASSIAQPERRPIYYGWKVLLALFFAGFMVYGGGLYCFVLFVPRMTEEFGWSRAATSGLFSAFWVTAPLILLGGWAIKRAGVYRLLIGGIVIEAVCVIVLATLSSLWQMYLLRILMGVGKVMFAVTLPYAISRWFSRHFSLGLGLAWAGWHIGGLVLAPLASVIIEHFGWRAACFAIGGGLLTIGLIPIVVTQRYRSPKELGLGLDGDSLATAEIPSCPSASPRAAEVPAGSLGALLRSPMFWLIALVTIFFYTTYGGLLPHTRLLWSRAPDLRLVSPRWCSDRPRVLRPSEGLPQDGYYDRYSIRAVGVCVHILMLASAMGLLAVARDHSETALIVYAVSFGITIGGGDLYFVALLRHRIETVSVAYIYSAWYFCELTTLLLTVAAGWVFDLTGNYNRTLALLAGSAAVALGLALLAMRRRGLESVPL